MVTPTGVEPVAPADIKPGDTIVGWTSPFTSDEYYPVTWRVVAPPASGRSLWAPPASAIWIADEPLPHTVWNSKQMCAELYRFFKIHIDRVRYPHACPRCGKPSWVSARTYHAPDDSERCPT